MSKSNKEENSLYPLRHIFEYKKKGLGPIHVQSYLYENDIEVNRDYGDHCTIIRNDSVIHLIFEEEYGDLLVFGHESAFKGLQLIELLESTESPVNLERVSLVPRQIPENINYVSPRRFEFICTNDFWPYQILEWILNNIETDPLNAIRDRRIIEPRTENPIYFRVNESLDGEFILQLEGYRLDRNNEIIKKLIGSESFKLEYNYVVGDLEPNSENKSDQEFSGF